MSVVPINIRPHLVPYFFKEFDGQQGVYNGKNIKSVKVATGSSIGKWFQLFMLQVSVPGIEVANGYYNIFLSIDENATDGEKYSGNYYRYETSPRDFIALPEDVNKALNELFEDIFRMGFISFMDGYMVKVKKPKFGDITRGIDEFIDKYDLLEVGLTPESMRQLYAREKKNLV
ncbi:hypothetical protein ACLI1A_10230 [Flavobacterium sp. RHBU_3]|uniref:hypothetical protein n=1 Tax=Flavobacterium sp. RHBU_3 TaxID=3391184 RepID=UPI0039855BDA